MAEKSLKFGKPGVASQEAHKAAVDSRAPHGQDSSATGVKTQGPEELNTGDDVSEAGLMKVRDLNGADGSSDNVVADREESLAASHAHKEATEARAFGEHETIFSCHPLQTLKIGRFKFEKTQLRLHKLEDIEEFTKMYEAQPATIRAHIKALDPHKANAMLRTRARSGMVSGIDTTANTLDPAPSLTEEAE